MLVLIKIIYNLILKTQIRVFQQLLYININNNKNINQINIRFNKISNMLFLSDLSSFKVFQKMRLYLIFRYY